MKVFVQNALLVRFPVDETRQRTQGEAKNEEFVQLPKKCEISLKLRKLFPVLFFPALPEAGTFGN